jgi:hypothetical protein
VNNSGGTYMMNVGTSDPAAPSCAVGYGQYPVLQSDPPNDPVTFTCSLGGVTGSLTNTITVTGVGPDGQTMSSTASAQVTVNAPAPFAPSSSPVRSTSHTPRPASPPPAASTLVPTLTVASISAVDLAAKRPTLAVTVKVSKTGRFIFSLRTSKGTTVASWSYELKPGLHKLALLVPLKARHAGHDTLRITETGRTKPIIRGVTLRR